MMSKLESVLYSEFIGNLGDWTDDDEDYDYSRARKAFKDIMIIAARSGYPHVVVLLQTVTVLNVCLRIMKDDGHGSESSRIIDSAVKWIMNFVKEFDRHADKSMVSKALVDIDRKRLLDVVVSSLSSNPFVIMTETADNLLRHRILGGSLQSVWILVYKTTHKLWEIDR